MRAKSLGVVFTAAMFLATVAFAQTNASKKNSSNQQNKTATSSQTNNSQSNTGVQGNEMVGKVTNYTPGQSIIVRTRNGNKEYDLKNAQANVDPSVKVGSRVRISETNNNGQRMINVEPAGAQRATTGRHGKLPKTGSEAPLLGLLGLMSLAAAAGVGVAAKKLG